jgi:hypothetical protein
MRRSEIDAFQTILPVYAFAPHWLLYIATRVRLPVHTEHSIRRGLGNGRGLELAGWAERVTRGLERKASGAGFFPHERVASL